MPIDEFATLETVRPALCTLRSNSRTPASLVSILNQDLSPSHSSTPSKPAFLISASPFSKDQPSGITFSPMDFCTL